MNPSRATRRSSYGRNSPTVRKKGARTRQRIIEVTLRLFEERGYHATAVEDIADRAAISRATLYQYFASKEQIFRELLDECGVDLLRLVRRLGPLGPTAQGFDNLNWWMGEWAWVYDKYSTVFAQWTQVDREAGSVEPVVRGFGGAFSRRLATGLQASGVEAADLETVSSLLAAAIHRFFYYRHQGALPHRTDEYVMGTVSVAAQLMLFPHTPRRVIEELGVVADSHHKPQRVGSTPSRTLPRSVADERSARGQRTADRLLTASATMFTRLGYPATTIDDIVTEAQVARATFYKYFTDKSHVLIELSQEAGARLPPYVVELDRVVPGETSVAHLERWIAELRPVHARYAGVIRAWIDGRPRLATVRAIIDHLADESIRVVGHLLNKVSAAYPLDAEVASVLILALVERGLDSIEGHEDDRAAPVVATLARLIDRGVLSSDSV